MRSTFLLIAICSGVLVVSSLAYAENDKCNLNRDTVENFNCDGPATLSEATVSDKLKVKGTVDAKNVNLNSMDVTGATKLNESEVKGDATVKGELTATRTSFKGNLTIDSNDAVLDSSSVKKSVTLQGDKKDPTLELRCNTHIKGDVVFKDAAGVVKKSGDSEISGQVTNGKVETTSDSHCDGDSSHDHDD